MNRVRVQFIAVVVACLAICIAHLNNTAMSLVLPSVIAVWVTFLFVREVLAPKQRLNLLDLAISIVLLACLTYVFARSNVGVWRSPMTLWLLTVDGLSLLAFLGVKLRRSHRLLSLRRLSSRRLTVVNFVAVLTFFTVVSLPVVFNLYSQRAQGYTAKVDYQSLHPSQPKVLTEPKLTSQEKKQLIADNTTTSNTSNASLPTELFTPASDLGIPIDSISQAILGRAGNDTIYGYDPGTDSQKSQKLDILLGDLFDNSTQEYSTILQIQAGNPVAILGQNPPIVGIDRFVLGDENGPYYTDNSGNPSALLTTNYLGTNEFALIYDFNPFQPNQDIIRLNGTKSDYALVDVNNFQIQGYTQSFDGKAIFSLQQGLPDLVAYVIENPSVKLDLGASYFEFVGAKPNTKPQNKQISELATTALDFSLDVATDPSNNFYLTGTSSGPLEGAVIGSTDAWVAKYDNNGNKLFGKQIGTTSADGAQAVTTDQAGNFYLTGTTTGNFFSSLNSSVNDAWVAKYDSNGNLIWGKQFGANVTTGFSTVTAGVNVDQAGNVYVTGTAIKPNTHPDIFNFSAQDDPYVIKFDSNGNQQWYTEIRDPNAPYPFNLAPFFDENYGSTIDKNGNSYLVGWTQGLIKESDPSRSLLKYDFWVSKVDTNGKLQWIQQVGSTNQGLEFGWNIATDSQGNAYANGWTTGDLGTDNQKAVDLDCKNQQVPQISCLYSPWLARFDPSGNLKFIVEFPSTADSGTYDSGMTIDSQDNIFIIGYTNTKLGKGSANAAYNAYVARFDTNGNNKWVQQFGSKNRLTYPTGITADRVNGLAITGFTDGPLGNAGSGTAGAVDAWFGQLDATNGKLTNFIASRSPKGKGNPQVDSDNNPGPAPTADASGNLVTAANLPSGSNVIDPTKGTNVNVGVPDLEKVVSTLRNAFAPNATNSVPQALKSKVNDGTLTVPNAKKQQSQ